jgi:hypothetical protein
LKLFEKKVDLTHSLDWKMAMLCLSRVKIGSIFFFSAIVLSFTFVLKKPDTTTQTQNNSSFKFENSDNTISENSNKLAVSVAPASFVIQQGTVKGENSPVKFDSDLETSLKIQEIPLIRLEYANESRQIMKVELPAKVQKIVAIRWLKTLQYCYLKQRATDYESEVNIEESYINDAAVYATTIDDFEITTPLEKRKFSQKEAFAIIHLTANLAIERYEELQNMTSQTNPRKIDEWNF